MIPDPSKHLLAENDFMTATIENKWPRRQHLAGVRATVSFSVSGPIRFGYPSENGTIFPLRDSRIYVELCHTFLPFLSI